VAWTDASQSETGFKVERKSGGGAFAQVASVATGVMSYTDSGLADGASYTYRVRAVNQGGESLPSNEASRVTLPAPPTALTVVALSSSQLQLAWTDSNPSPPAVKVERSAAMTGPFTQVGVSSPGLLAYNDSGLSANTAYYYRIRTTNASGDSAYSGVSGGSTLPAPPAAPNSFAAAAVSGRSVQLTWQDNSSNETGFEVLRLAPQAGGYELIATTGSNAVGYLDSVGVAGNTAYSYRVRAVNAGGGSAYASASVTTPPDPPAPPTGLVGLALSHTQVRLTWSDASDNETGFRIQRRTGAAAFETVTTTGPNVLEYVNGGLTEGVAYTYRVVAVNSQGDSTPSSEVTVITRPQSPGNLVATVGNRRIDLTWTDRSARETGFRIERHSGDGGFAAMATVAASVRTYADTGLAPEHTYTYRVIAISAEGDSEPSNSAVATPRNETPLAKLVIAPKSLKFGTVKLNRPKQKTLKLTNKGREAVIVTVGTLDAPFTLVSGGGAVTLAPRASRTVAVRFNPIAAGTAQASLLITSTDPRAAQTNVTVTGKGK
jgi:predicted phage tail protein